jgi:hypothetical protein
MQWLGLASIISIKGYHRDVSQGVLDADSGAVALRDRRAAHLSQVVGRGDHDVFGP